MKSFLLLIPISLIFFSQRTNAQCTEDAGNDTIFCSGNKPDSFYLGGQPTAVSGTSPFQYTWSANYVTVPTNLTASDLLDDTTAANPRLIPSF